MTEMTRRHAVLLLGALGGSALVNGLTVGELLSASPRPDTTDDLLDRFSRNLDGDGVDQLGAAYLELYPEEADEDRLVEEVLSNSSGSDEVKAFLRGKVGADFEAGRTVELFTWMLSRTEGRILAALHLTS